MLKHLNDRKMGPTEMHIYRPGHANWHSYCYKKVSISLSRSVSENLFLKPMPLIQSGRQNLLLKQKFEKNLISEFHAAIAPTLKGRANILNLEDMWAANLQFFENIFDCVN